MGSNKRNVINTMNKDLGDLKNSSILKGSKCKQMKLVYW